MGGISGFVHTVLDLLGVRLSQGAWASIVVAVVLLSAPWWWGNLRTDQARRLLRAAARARGPAREALEAEALERVRGRVWGLVAVADVALSQGRTAVVESALAELRRLRAPLVALRRLERALHGDLPATAVEARLRVDALRSEGLHVGADDLLVRARARWPGASELDEPR
jgi:hypothetical protein